MIPKHIVKLAIEGGWKPKSQSFSLPHVSYKVQAMMKVKNKERFILDPSFWQAIGKAKGWKKWLCKCGKYYDKEGTILCPNCRYMGANYSWHVHARKFFDLLMVNDDVKTYWDNLK